MVLDLELLSPAHDDDVLHLCFELPLELRLLAITMMIQKWWFESEAEGMLVDPFD